jgi:hypothetical protein
MNSWLSCPTTLPLHWSSPRSTNSEWPAISVRQAADFFDELEIKIRASHVLDE